MGYQPASATGNSDGGNHQAMPENQAITFRLNDAQCDYINANVGVARQTLKDVAAKLNQKFGLHLSYEQFVESRAAAISEGRCRTTYFRNYYKGENSSEKELRKQRSVLLTRLTGGCQFQNDQDSPPCGAPTMGRFCETHVRAGHIPAGSNLRGQDYIDSTLGRYG